MSYPRRKHKHAQNPDSQTYLRQIHLEIDVVYCLNNGMHHNDIHTLCERTNALIIAALPLHECMGSDSRVPTAYTAGSYRTQPNALNKFSPVVPPLPSSPMAPLVMPTGPPVAMPSLPGTFHLQIQVVTTKGLINL
jgi:hypothetical protein